MFTVIVTLDVVPAHIEEFIELIAENARLSVATEPGCIRFDVSRSVEVDNRFFLYESYVDEAAFRFEHKGSDHFADFVARSAGIVIPGTKTEVYAALITEKKKSNVHVTH